VPCDAEPLVIAAKRRRVSEKEMRHEDRLGRPQMRERGHHRVAGRSRLLRQRCYEIDEGVLQERKAAPQIQAQVDRDLLVARTPGVKTTAGIAEPLGEQALDEGVNVLVAAVDE